MSPIKFTVARETTVDRSEVGRCHLELRRGSRKGKTIELDYY